MNKSTRFIIVTAIVVFLFGISTVGCGPSQAEREAIARADSIIRADSLAKAEAARIEQARRDSIARDSIELAEFAKAIPSANELFSEDGMLVMSDIAPFLQSRGFKISNKKTERMYDHVEDTYYNYTIVTYTLEKASENV